VVLVRIAAFPGSPDLEVNRTDDGAGHVFDFPTSYQHRSSNPLTAHSETSPASNCEVAARVDYGPCLRPDTINAVREAAITIQSAAATDDSRFFGSVVSHELLDGYQGTGIEAGWSVGPMILNLYDGQSLAVVNGWATPTTSARSLPVMAVSWFATPRQHPPSTSSPTAR